MSRTQTSSSSSTSTAQKQWSFTARGEDAARRPVKTSGPLRDDSHRPVNPVLGDIFPTLRLKEDVWDLPASQRDAFLRDLALLIARRGVVVFKRQDSFPPELLGELVHRLGQLSGKPATSHLHLHPLSGDFNEDGSKKGGEKITSEPDKNGAKISFMDERSDFASAGWHTDISFEPVPADFTVLRMNEIPECGGDTIFASAYEAYDRLSPAMQTFLEGLTATHDAEVFKRQAERYNFKLRTLPRGCPEDVGDDFKASHPVIRTHRVTGWKTLFVNQTFTSRINELKKDESDLLLRHLFRLVADNHNLQMRHTWDQNDVVIWDNTAVLHNATFDYGDAKRSGDRAVSLGERPFFDSKSRSRRQALASEKA